MQPKDTAPLREAIRETAARMMAEGEGDQSKFVRLFQDAHGDLFAEYVEYMGAQYLADEGRKAIKSISKAMLKTIGSSQLDLPMSMEDLEIPTALVVPSGNGRTRWVPRDLATLDDGQAYIKVLQQNVDACFAALTDFLAFWKQVRPLLEANPDWRVGDAIRFLADSERDAA